MDASVAPDVISRPVSPRLAHLVSSISFYRERGVGLTAFRHAAPLALPLLVNLGTPFRIALGRRPDGGDVQPSFVAGLFPGQCRSNPTAAPPASRSISRRSAPIASTAARYPT